MTRHEFADRLEHYASRVRAIRGVGRNGPHAFVEDKSEIIAALMAEARELRAMPVISVARAQVGNITTGRRTVDGGREIAVVMRRRRA